MSVSTLKNAAAAAAVDPLLQRYRTTRARSVALAAPLSAEDQTAQSMPDASPTKWHLAHTSWFYETFMLSGTAGYRVFDPAFGFLFNSYYEAVGPRLKRDKRGLVTRPSVDQVLAFRAHVDAAMEGLIASGEMNAEQRALLVLGFAHEEQHQELLLTDALHLLAQNPLLPAYDKGLTPPATPYVSDAAEFLSFEGGVVELGQGSAEAEAGFDNETPRHQVLLRPYRLADRLVTNGEWAAFIEDGGYQRPELWLSDGWATATQEGWTAPLYWQDGGDGTCRSAFTLAGVSPLVQDAAVSHVSYYEADAFARWAGRRLPTEAEWERAAAVQQQRDPPERALRLPYAARPGDRRLQQMFGVVWQWTASPYTAYPGFKAVEGAVGEYNGKFMINQMVLRGASFATYPGHSRATYRNFFQPWQRWQFTGLRLADDA